MPRLGETGGGESVAGDALMTGDNDIAQQARLAKKKKRVELEAVLSEKRALSNETYQWVNSLLKSLDKKEASSFW